MNKFISFKDTFYNVEHIARIYVNDKHISITFPDGGYIEYKPNQYTESEKTQLVEDLQSFM
jgi:hypothetical protein